MPPPRRAHRHRRGRQVLHVGAGLLLCSYTGVAVSALFDSDEILISMFCVLQPIGFVLMFVGSRMAPTSVVADRREKS